MPDSAFDAWYNEIEGFALRAERLTGPKAELMAAFEAGRAAAIEALMEPTPEQRIAGAHAADIRPSDAKNVLVAMLSEALSPSLKEQEEGN